MYDVSWGLKWFLWWGGYTAGACPPNPVQQRGTTHRWWLLFPRCLSLITPGEQNGYPLRFWPGEFHGQRSLAGYRPRGHTELHTTNTFSFTWHPGGADVHCVAMAPHTLAGMGTCTGIGLPSLPPCCGGSLHQVSKWRSFVTCPRPPNS